MNYYGFTFLKVEQRWKEHYNLALKSNIQRKFFKAIREFGIENWSLEVLETFDTEFFAKAFEIYCIDKFDTLKNGYNSTEGGEGVSGWKVSDEQKISKSKNQKGRKYINRKKPTKYTQEHCDNISKSLKGKKG